MNKKIKRRKSVKLPNSQYARWKSQLKGIYRFNFKSRTRFTSPQRSQIRRAYNRYKNIIEARDKGHASILRATPSEIRSARSRYDTTNMVIVVYGSVVRKVSIIKKPHKKTLLRFRRINKKKPVVKTADLDDHEIDRLLRLQILRETFGDFDRRTLIREQGEIRQQIFVPLLEGERLDELIDYIWWYFNPSHVLFSVGKSQSTQSYTQNEWDGYREILMMHDRKIRESYSDRGEKEKTPFNGAYAVWYTSLQYKTNRIK